MEKIMQLRGIGIAVCSFYGRRKGAGSFSKKDRDILTEIASFE